MITQPIIIDGTSQPGRKLMRADVGVNEERNEAWLRDLLFQHPTLLPVDSFDERFGPLIPIAKELNCNMGRVDAVFASPHGRLTLVETKLWRNPERHRDVVAQIIGYAQAIAAWDVAQLSDAVKSASPTSSDLDTLMREHLTGPHTLDTFHEKLASRLPVADFLLLIVGDRISPNAALLSSVISGAPGLRFQIGLIEMHMYQATEGRWPLIVVPEVVGKTVEHERLVVRIEHVGVTPKVTIEPTRNAPSDADNSTEVDKSRIYSSIEDFLADPDLDSHFVDTYRDGIDLWRAIGGTPAVKPRWVYWMVDVGGTPQEVIRCQDYRIGILRKEDWTRLGASAEARDRYLAALSKIPAARDAVAKNKMLIEHSALSADEGKQIIKATVELGRALQQ